MNELYIWGGLIAAALIIGWWAWPKKEKVAEEVKTEPAPSAPTVAVNDQITDAVTQTAPVKKPRAKKPVAPKTTAAKAKKAPAKKAKKK